MPEKDLEESGRKILEVLTEIRERVRAPKIEFDIHKQVMSSAQFLKISKKIPVGQPLIINGRFSFVYIKDHLFWSTLDFKEKMLNAPNQCFMDGKRVHFYMCPTLKTMENKGRSERYCHTTHLRENKCEIDLKGQNDVAVRLGWCQNCLYILLRDGNVPYKRGARTFIQYRASVGGDSVKIMGCVKGHHRKNDDRIEKIRKFFLPFMEH